MCVYFFFALPLLTLCALFRRKADEPALINDCVDKLYAVCSRAATFEDAPATMHQVHLLGAVAAAYERQTYDGFGVKA